jgi:SEFIR domain/Pentapeptide repeats (8 copies)
MPKIIRVFISYSHDSMVHSARVLHLAQRLRRDGIDCIIDKFVPFPSRGWVRWMDEQVREADFVLCVCTASYRMRFEGRDETSDGKGSNWEGQILSQHLYDDKGMNARFVPVIFDDQNPQDVVPSVLKPYTQFVLDRQYEQLYALVTGQSAVPALPIGELRKLDVISPGMPSPEISLNTANLIDNSLREIAAGPNDSATQSLYELERWADYSSDGELRDAVVCNLVSYIRALDTSKTYPKGERLFRADVVRVLIRLTGGRLGAFLTVGGLRGIDLAMFDFRGADLTGIDFSNSFAIECDFRGTTLDGANLRRCSIRNARFNGASLVDVDFTEADWFNALGLNTAQLASCRTDTLLDCPATENEFMAYLATHYGFPFRSWGRRVQRELREAWADYTQPEGLAADVRRWRRREWDP